MAFKGAGSALRVGDGGSPTEAFTTIAEVIETSGPEQVNDEIETTNLSSTAKEFMSALKDSGSMDFECHFAPSNAQHQTLFADAGNGTVRNYRMEWDDGNSPKPYIQFAAFVARLSNATPPNESVKMSGSLRISGALTTSW